MVVCFWMSSSKCVKHIQDENMLNNIQNYTKLRQPEQIILIVTEKVWLSCQQKKTISAFCSHYSLSSLFCSLQKGSLTWKGHETFLTLHQLWSTIRFYISSPDTPSSREHTLYQPCGDVLDISVGRGQGTSVAWWEHPVQNTIDSMII